MMPPMSTPRRCFDGSFDSPSLRTAGSFRVVKARKLCAVALLVSLGFVGATFGQKPAVSAVAHHSLWRVQGTSNVVYLLGSVHLLKPSDYPLAQPIEAAFNNAQIAVFETDIGELEQPKTQLKMMAKSQLPAGETLAGQLSPAVYASFTNQVVKDGLMPELFERFKPFLAATTLEVFELQKLGLDPAYGVDLYFFHRARKEGKQIIPLETLDFQISLVTGFSKQEGELLMKGTLKEIDNTRKLFSQMVSDWKTGNADRLGELLNKGMSESPAIFKRLVTDRNRRWVPKIEKLLRGNRTAIVIVGAGHLVGKEGVVALLKKDGWKVTQL